MGSRASWVGGYRGSDVGARGVWAKIMRLAVHTSSARHSSRPTVAAAWRTPAPDRRTSIDCYSHPPLHQISAPSTRPHELRSYDLRSGGHRRSALGWHPVASQTHQPDLSQTSTVRRLLRDRSASLRRRQQPPPASLAPQGKTTTLHMPETRLLTSVTTIAGHNATHAWDTIAH
jgi:hypothetical protein